MGPNYRCFPMPLWNAVGCCGRCCFLHMPSEWPLPGNGESSSIAVWLDKNWQCAPACQNFVVKKGVSGIVYDPTIQILLCHFQCWRISICSTEAYMNVRKNCQARRPTESTILLVVREISTSETRGIGLLPDVNHDLAHLHGGNGL